NAWRTHCPPTMRSLTSEAAEGLRTIRLNINLCTESNFSRYRLPPTIFAPNVSMVQKKRCLIVSRQMAGTIVVACFYLKNRRVFNPISRDGGECGVNLYSITAGH